MKHRIGRRQLLQSGAAAGFGVWVTGLQTWADELASKSPNERVNVACIGIGGKGDSDSEHAASIGNLIAICDIDDKRLAGKKEKHPKAADYYDFRKLFDKHHKEIDAVTVTTPDHTHAVASMMAIKLGKGVYTQKPLAHDVFEARQLRLAAADYKVSTQMGNQGTSSEKFRAGVEMIRSGAIGNVTEVHVWTDRPRKYWQQSPDIKELPPKADIPSYVHWDQWIGTAPMRDYGAKVYHPHNWRGWWDFGCGALGDMACHIMNQPFMALKLEYPESISAESEALNPFTYPGWAKVVYQFPKRGELPPVTFRWYEGTKDGELVLPPKELCDQCVAAHNEYLAGTDDKRVKKGKKVELPKGGAILVGDKGIFYSPHDYGGEWYLVPSATFKGHKAPEPTLPRNGAGDDHAHKEEWLAGVKGLVKPMSGFHYSGLLAETVLLGNVAIRNGGAKLDWDGANMRFTNAPKAEALLRREYRAPWSL